jgi:hypothetical protein
VLFFAEKMKECKGFTVCAPDSSYFGVIAVDFGHFDKNVYKSTVDIFKELIE